MKHKEIKAIYYMFLREDQRILASSFSAYVFGNELIFSGTLLEYAKKAGIGIKIKVC